MGLKTDFNKSPYFDDFDETKNFHRVLFKPAVAVQARELTQLQTILQNQIERFGNNILVEGTIIQGGNFVEEDALAYVKLLDVAKNEFDNEVATDINQYVGLKAVGKNNNVEAIVIATEYGLESQTPNLSTLFVKYTKTALDSANTNIKTFVAGESVQLFAKDSSGDYTVLKYTVTVPSTTIDANPVGSGYGVRCGEGIIYQKGHFIRFTDALTIVSKYSNTPDGVVVGFQTTEEIIDSNDDSSLLDGAYGFNNENAPGADRLKLSPGLVVKTLDEAAADDTFFAIQEYASGKVVRRKNKTQYNVIEKEMERRTSEESGNYVVDRFNIYVETDTANTSNLSVVIGQGIAYVDGQRVELLDKIKLDLPDANTFSNVYGQDINTNYGNYAIVSGYTGNFNYNNLEQVQLYRSGDLTNPIGTGRVRSVTKQADGNYRLYLMAIAMSNTSYTFANTAVIKSSSGGSANTVLVSNTAVLKDDSFNKTFFPIGKSFIKSIDAANTDFVYRTISTSQISNATLVLTVTSPDVFPYTPSGTLNSDELLDIIVVANSSVGPISSGESIGVTSASLDSTGRQLTVTLAKNPGANLYVNSYYNVKKKQVSIATKELDTVYIKIQANTHPNTVAGPYSLGLPDVYQISGIWKGGSSTTWNTLEGYANTDSTTSNFTQYFTLNNAQTDTHYGLSYLKKKSSITIGANDKIIVKAKVFNKTAGVGHFFTVDSYPIDDVTATLPADKIRTEDIPTYTTQGVTYNLRDVIDLRPYATATVTYATTPSAANTNPSNSLSFTGIVNAAPNKTIETAYSYYLGRNDIVIIDKNGQFELIKGTPAETPSFPPEPTKGMLLARIVVPPFPTLSTATAQKLRKPDYGVTLSTNQTQRYTMKDIGDIDQRVKNIEYYTSLSLLETSAKDFLVTDAAGNDRFKNGIFVDNFDTLYLADVNGGEFAAAVDPSSKSVTPKIRQYSLGLKPVDSASNGTKNNAGTYVTLDYTKNAIPSVSQPFATTVKNCTTSFYNYAGKMSINPSYDSGPDTVIAPDVNFSIDLATPFIEFTEALAQFIPLSSTSTQVISSTRSGFLGLSRTTTTQTTTRNLVTTAGSEVTTDVGDFVRDVSFLPYMRGRDINVKVVGLRPNTRYYFFFDGVASSDRVTPAAPNADGTLYNTGLRGAPVISDSNGTVYAVFSIKANTFYVGDRKLEIMDVDSLSARDAATSYASAVYSGFNFAVTKSGVSSTTRPPQFDIATTVTTTTRRSGSDPIAQTFIIDSGLSNDSDVFITGIDLFFARKSRAGKGIGIQIREVENGYPSGKALPFSSVYLSAAQVNAPDDRIYTTATAKTHVDFEGPVALKVNTEYAIVVAPDGNDPDYLMWICRTGEADVDTGKYVTQDSNAGVLFTSTNNKTWTPYQNENMKFTLYAANFTTQSGYMKLINDGHEFLTVNNVSGQFESGEGVFPIKTYNSGTVQATVGNNVINGTGTSFLTNYAVDDYIVLTNGTSYQAHKIKTIVSDTQLITYNLWVNSFLSSSPTINHYRAPLGNLIYVDTNEPPRMVLEGSSAKVGEVFTAGQTLIGNVSGATAQLVSVDNLPISYVQPCIYRVNFTKTRTTLQASALWNGTSEKSMDLNFNSTNYLSDDLYYIASKSSSPTNSHFALQVNLENVSGNSTNQTSPVIDHAISSVMIAEYLVNTANTTNNIDGTELLGNGNAKAKYVSKTITLADGLDAEDIRVILGAYHPTGTDIRVYARLKAATDNRAMSDVEWTPLVLKPESDTTSSVVNRDDYREYEFTLSTTSKTVGQGAWDNSGVVNYIANIDGNSVKFNNYKYFAIKVVMLADGHNIVPRLKDIRALALT